MNWRPYYGPKVLKGEGLLEVESCTKKPLVRKFKYCDIAKQTRSSDEDNIIAPNFRVVD